LASGFAIPLDSLILVTLNAISYPVENTKSVLCVRVSLLGGFAIPDCGLVGAMRNSVARFVGLSQAELGGGFSGVSSFLKVGYFSDR